MNNSMPFHLGEVAVQQKAQVHESAKRNGRMIKNTIMPGAITFVGQQQMVAVASMDEGQNLWCSLLFAEQGFVQVPDISLMSIDTNRLLSVDNQLLWRNVDKHSAVGLVALELASRRRLRVNGKMLPTTNGCYELIVEQAYPNCPKYITRRDLHCEKVADSKVLPVQKGQMLTDEQKQLITQADSFFVATAQGTSSNDKLDASYRGGQPGFIVLDGDNLLIPDYQGNNMFNTLGNIECFGNAGLVFIDFDNNQLLQLSGSAQILWDMDDSSDKTGGTKRFWRFSTERWLQVPLPDGITWQFGELSPHNPI